MSHSSVKSATSVVVPLKGKTAAKRSSEAKWGALVMKPGFCILPALLLRAQRRLGLTPSQLGLIVQLCDFWWDGDAVPWPKKETVAQRLGVSEKQVQRIARALEERGYLERIKRSNRHGRTSNGYDLSGLVAKLEELAPEFIAASDAKRRVERRGGLKTASS